MLRLGTLGTESFSHQNSNSGKLARLPAPTSSNGWHSREICILCSIKVRRGFCHEQCSYKIPLGLGKIYKKWCEKLPYLCKTTRMSLYLGMLLQKKHIVCAIYKRKTSSSLLKLLNFTYTHFLGKIQVLGTLLV